MANQQAALASSRAAGFVQVKTPDGQDAARYDALAGVSPWSTRFRFVGNFAQLLIFASMGMYVFGQIIYFTPTYSDSISVTFKEWWGVATTTTATTGGAAAAPKGHSEMVLPTHFLLFGMLPLLVSALLIEFLRHFNLRRISSHYMLKFALVLRRKPALFGRVSHWSYGEWIFLLGLVGGNVYVFYHFYSSRVERMKSRIKGPIQFNVYLECVALTLGFSCIFNLAFLFLPATRNCAWMEFFNISYANGIKYHRWLGVITVLTAFVHCVGYYWSWIRQGTWQAQALPCFDCNLGERKGLKVWFNVFGEIALLIFLIIGLTSIPFIRRKFYNVFYYSHQLLFLGVIFSVMHWGNVVWWVLPPFVIYCFSRAMSMSSNFSPIDVGEVTAISEDIVKVVIKRSPGRDGHYRVGQFLYLNVPAISKLQWHAFTIASSPRASPRAITVLIKSLGDWTDELVQHANECQVKNVLPTVYVDGFYGASLELYNEYSTVCLVGGGIGVTPLFSVLEDISAQLSSHGALKQKVVFIFSFRELALLEEIHPVLLRLRELDPHEQYFRTHLFLTRVPSDDVLNTRINTARLQGKQPHPTAYETKALSVAFTEPLRSRTYRALAMTTVVAVAVLLVVYLHYGGDKIKLIDPALWPLQQFAEASVAILAGGLVLLYVFAERLSKHKTGSFGDAAAKEIETNLFDSATTPALAFADVHTYSDLVSQYRVALGERPDTEELLARTFELHADESIPSEGNPVIGVFVSGPVAMKRAVDRAVNEIGARHFDVHEEEFEL